MADKVIVLEIALPSIYTDDLDSLREYQDHFDSVSEWLLNCIGEPSVCRVRTEISGEKEGDVVEVWGHVRGARLEDADSNTEEHLAEIAGHKLLRDERSCEWCDFDTHAASPQQEPSQ